MRQVMGMGEDGGRDRAEIAAFQAGSYAEMKWDG